MAYVTPLYGASSEQLDYRLGEQHGCGDDFAFGYRTDLRERPLYWIGDGLGEHGLTAGAQLTEGQFDTARALIAGADPRTGEQLVTGKLAVPADAKVSGEALVSAVRAAAATAGTDPEAVLAGGTAKDASRYARVEREVSRRGAAAMLRADHAGAIAAAAGLDVDAVWGGGVHAAAVANLTETVTVTDPVSGAVTTAERARRVDVGIKGFDINIGLPKSLSVLLAVAPEDVAAAAEATYQGAVERVFAWTEGRTSYVLRGQHGEGRTARREPSSGFAGWVMTHRTARPVAGDRIGDPHWHVHITIANMVRGADGRWSNTAAGGRDLMRHAAAIDKLTQAEVRAVLSAQLGVEFARSPRTGLWEIAAVPDETLRLFSRRGIAVRALLEELGYTPGEATAAEERIRSRDSREAKTAHTTDASDTTLREHWQQRMRTAGQDPDGLVARILDGPTTPTPAADVRAGRAVRMAAGDEVNVVAVAAAVAHPETGVTANSRRFSRLDALARVADEMPTGATIAEVERITDLVLGSPLFRRLPTSSSNGASAVRTADAVEADAAAVTAARVGPAGGVSSGARRQLGARHMTDPGLWTTTDVTAAEQQILAAAAAARPGQGFAAVDGRTRVLALDVVAAAQGFALSEEQRQVVAVVTGGGRSLDVVRGPAGTGKTTVMRAARVAWEAAGYRVAGAATAAVAAQQLQTESGIASRTVASWLHTLNHSNTGGSGEGNGFEGVDVLVLDEANLTDDRARAALYTAAQQHGVKVVEIGDEHQLRGVGCGSMFGHLHRVLGGPELTENRRQHDEDARRILASWRDGRYHAALQELAAGGRLVATETGDEALSAMVAAWFDRAAGAPDPHQLIRGLAMLAPTNEQVDRINIATQAARAAAGQLGAGAGYPTGAGREAWFHVGDQVLLRVNDRETSPQRTVSGATVLNGYRGVVTDLDRDHVTVAWVDPAGALQSAQVSRAYIASGGLELGYAITVHKAEGLTVAGNWTRTDGTSHHGDVLIYGAGADNPATYVALSRPRGDAIVFAARADVESDRDLLQHGTPANPDVLTARVATALAEHATTTAESINDRPVSVDLGLTSEPPTHQPTSPTADEHQAVDEHQAADEGAAAALERNQAAVARRADRIAAERTAEQLATQTGRGVPPRLHALLQDARSGQISDARRDALVGYVFAADERWDHRPHGHQSSAALVDALAAAVADRDRHIAELPALTEQATAWQQRLATGPGPREQDLRDRHADLQARAATADALEDSTKQVSDARYDAERARGVAQYAARDLDALPWYRRGERARATEHLAGTSTAAAAAEQRHADLAGQHKRLTAQAETTYGQLPDRRDSHAWFMAQRNAESELHSAQVMDQAHGAEAQRKVGNAEAGRDKAQNRIAGITSELDGRDQWSPQRAHTELLYRLVTSANDRLTEHDDAAARAEKARRTRDLGERDYITRTRLDGGLDHGRGHGLSR